MRKTILIFFSLLFFTVSAFASERVVNDKENAKAYFDGMLEDSRAGVKYLLELIDKKDFAPLNGIGVELSLPGDEEVPQVVIFQAIKGKPADRAGITRGDVVLSVNGKKVSSSKEFRKEVIGDNSAGRAITLEVDRSGVKVVATMVTASIYGDRRESAKKLREAIAREGEALLAEMKSVFEKAIEAGKIDENDLRVKTAFSLAEKFEEWYQKRDDDVLNLYFDKR